MASGWMVNTVVLVFTLVAGLIVFLRLITRGVLLRNAGFEDVYSTFAMVASVGLTISIALQIQNGLGKHIFDLTELEEIHSQKAFWVSIWVYNLALTSTKLSVLVQYLRIFQVARFRLVCFVSIGVVGAWGLWTVFGSIYICLPVSFFWDKSILPGKCLNEEVVWFTNASVNIAQDVLILLMPIPVLRGLALPVKQKRALIVVFLFGGVVCVISIIRFRFLAAISNSTDPTFNNLLAAMLSAIEVNVGIICACLPSMRPLLSSMMPTYFPDGSRDMTARKTYDEERVKRLQSMSDISYPARAASRGQYSCQGSNGQPYTPGRESKSSHSRTGSCNSSRSHPRNGSQVDNIHRRPSDATYTRTSNQSRTHSNNNSRAPSRNGPTQLENLYRGPPSVIDPTQSSNQSHTHWHSQNPSNSSNSGLPQSRNGSHPEPYISQAMLTSPSHGIHGPVRQMSTGSVHQQHQLHPLRLSPNSPVIPRLPRLPEQMANFDPFQRGLGSPLGPPHTPRRLVFHKPLPVTPYPIQMAAAPAVEKTEANKARCMQCATGICTLHLVVQSALRTG